MPESEVAVPWFPDHERQGAEETRTVLRRLSRQGREGVFLGHDECSRYGAWPIDGAGISILAELFDDLRLRKAGTRIRRRWKGE